LPVSVYLQSRIAVAEAGTGLQPHADRIPAKPGLYEDRKSATTPTYEGVADVGILRPVDD
jgi:hypothetical protein